jgi:hypothetical protein
VFIRISTIIDKLNGICGHGTYLVIHVYGIMYHKNWLILGLMFIIIIDVPIGEHTNPTHINMRVE